MRNEFLANLLNSEDLSAKKKLAYLLGALRDGCFTKNEKNSIYRIRIYQKNKEWILKVGKIAADIFGKQPTIFQDKRDSVWCLMLNSRQIYDTLVALSDYPQNQREWSTPKWILSSPLDIQKEYVKGFFDSEGGVSRIEKKKFDPTDMRIYFCQANKQSLEELKKLISNFGIKTGKVCGPYYKKGYEKPVHGLRIHGIKEITMFSKVIGSIHPEKLERFMLIEEMAKSPT